MTENSGIHKLAESCRKYNHEWDNPQTDAEKLRKRILTGGKTNEEYLELEDELREFFKSAASDDDKRIVGSCAESLHMICNAIREERL